MSVGDSLEGAGAWTQDGAGHPIYLQGDDLEAAREEWLRLSHRADKVRLRLGAIAWEVSKDRVYGKKNLERFAKLVDENYKVLDNLKQVYRRIDKLEISDRSEILRKLENGQTCYTKLLVCSPIENPRTFVDVATRLEENGRPVPTTAVRREAKAIKEEQRTSRLAATAKANPLLPWLMLGEYKTLVVDPPWEMKTFQSGAYRYRNSDWPYEYLTEDELAVFEPMRMLPSAESHLYLWSTHGHLETSLRLIKAWGYSHQCTLTWIKGGGVVPFSWQYNTELVLFATRGGLPLVRKGLSLHFHEKAREHSRKPDALYDLVRLASPEPRIDVFSREHREGFDSWGDQAGYFSEQPYLPLLENW